MKINLKQFTTFQIIIFGFATAILVGSFLLMLPCSSAEGKSTNFIDALFTATSAVCVTGLVVQDTVSYWSEFGKIIILIMIQIGGLGIVSVAAALSLVSGKRINLKQRSTMQEALSAPQVGGIVKLTGFIIKMVIIIELIGCILMAPVFCSEFGVLRGIWYAVFHSVSAFCNAGFDLMGVNGEYSSLATYSSNIIINIVVMSLVIIGGIGFLTWDDIKTNKFHLKKYRMQSKVVLTVSGILIFLPAIYYFFYEFSRDSWNMSTSERVLTSLFQSVSPRTAGFYTVNLAHMRQGSVAIMIVLMLIGGSSGSTAGGMKTATFAVLLSSAISVFKRKEDTHFFGRRIPSDTINKAIAILIMYLVLFVTGGIIISNIENLPLLDCLFETASAIGTVGLSLGITSGLSTASHIILIVLMFVGRVGGLTFVFAAFSPKSNSLKRLPLEKINIG